MILLPEGPGMAPCSQPSALTKTQPSRKMDVGRGRGWWVDTVSEQLLPQTQRTPQCSFFLFLSEGGRLGGNGGQVALCLSGNHSPSSKINCLTWHFLPSRCHLCVFRLQTLIPVLTDQLSLRSWDFFSGRIIRLSVRNVWVRLA